MVKAKPNQKSSSRRAQPAAKPKKADTKKKAARPKKAKAKPTNPAPKKTPAVKGRVKSKRSAAAAAEGDAAAGAEAGAAAAAPAPTSRKLKKKRAVSSAAPVNTADEYFDGGVNESAAPTVALLNTFEEEQGVVCCTGQGRRGLL